MRTFLGYVMIAFLIPLLSILFILLYGELDKAEGIHTVLQEKIPVDSIELPQTSYIAAADGTVISEISGPEKRVYLPGNNIPTFLKDLFVTIEDRQFYHHSGIDAAAISRALVANTRSNSIEQGGSTITQQLARNLFLSPEKSYNRKLTELLYSYQLERTLSKAKILELYINAIYYQNGVYGIESAARFYFDSHTTDLSKAQLAFLAAIPNNPNLYNPLKHFDSTKKRQERILDQMVQTGKLSKSEYNNFVKEQIILKHPDFEDHYPDYSDYALAELKALIASSEGYEKKLENPNEKVREAALKELNTRVGRLLESGITIHTALDKNIQRQAVQSVNGQLGGASIEGAVVVIQHNMHELVSVVGGKHYKKNSFNRAYQSFRQPGSAIKPLLVYAPYIEENDAAISQLVSGAAYCRNGYCPKNYSGNNYGMVTLQEALAKSYNTPAVRLLEETGIKKSFGYLKPFQFEMVNQKDHHLPAAIGGFNVGVSPIELTNAFTSFNDGTYEKARAIRKVTGKDGKILYRWNDKPKMVWDGSTVYKMKILLNGVVTSGTARKAYFPSKYIGGKTGTTNDYKDMWFVGLTDRYTTGVWVGKDQPGSIEYLQAKSPALQIWKQINQGIDQVGSK
ncbi:transglycosylase domain-containing protein [Peribacillus sp. SCS-155]|uniref:transglycosylase domain-containing protein n=1 Tax=Peribacillus sedimenti TaxID=3115297 RepID=UPI003905B72F